MKVIIKNLVAIAVLVGIQSQAHSRQFISKQAASTTAATYVRTIYPQVENYLDGESLEEALATYDLKLGDYSQVYTYHFTLQDNSGDCSMEVSVNAFDGNIELKDTDSQFRCN